MTGQTLARNWEYCHVGPADSFQGLVGELKTKADEGWELTGVRNESSRVYATVKRPADHSGLLSAVQVPRMSSRTG